MRLLLTDFHKRRLNMPPRANRGDRGSGRGGNTRGDRGRGRGRGGPQRGGSPHPPSPAPTPSGQRRGGGPDPANRGTRRGRGRGQTVQVASQATTVAADCMWSSIFHAMRVYIDGLQRPSCPLESDVRASAMLAKRYPCWSICSSWRSRRGISTSTTVSITQSSDMLDTNCAPQSVRD